MYNILKVIYDLSINDRFIDSNQIDKFLEIIINNKNLDKYISNVEFKTDNSNNMASYSNYNKRITIYENMIKKMISYIQKNLKTDNLLVKNMYINLSILQVLLHEIEHANQEKIIINNDLEAFILRISKMVQFENQTYEYLPNERFAEIKSYDEIIKIIYNYDCNLLLDLIKTDKFQRQIRGYHYYNKQLYSPIESFFIKGNKENLLTSFDWYSIDSNIAYKNAVNIYGVENCLFYGFPISNKEYVMIMDTILTNLNKNYKNKIKLIKKV